MDYGSSAGSCSCPYTSSVPRKDVRRLRCCTSTNESTIEEATKPRAAPTSGRGDQAPAPHRGLSGQPKIGVTGRSSEEQSSTRLQCIDAGPSVTRGIPRACVPKYYIVRS
ncbi:uncharacterized protein LOC125943291 isoform X2 [Dermacentor silvarum]|uniref:uncharacterized protein LOC125943291 isoform X2 n=1 Tax=Dermacentor silvarum TaxID=543639 RepID=UPI002100A1B3|nr:uncharacterized protein LOC125943291 isoform X2 [Dermacentor silvarum]